MHKSFLSFLLLAPLASAQMAPPSAPTQSPAAAAPSAPAADAQIPPDAPILTIHGVCDHPPADGRTENCKKVITRAQFEQMVQVVQPNLTPAERRQFASRYVNGLVLDQKARESGFGQGPDFAIQMKAARDQVLTQELNLKVYRDAMNMTDADVETYYKQNPLLYTEADLAKVLIPGIQQLPAPAKPLSDAEQQKRNEESEKVMKAEAESVRTRALAGEDLNKLQIEGYKLALIKDDPPDAKLGKLRGSSLPTDQLSVMELKPGEISDFFLDRAGYVIYKMGEKRLLGFDQVRDEVRKALLEQRRKAGMEKALKGTSATFNPAYFGQ